jgi:hypothetical protein
MARVKGTYTISKSPTRKAPKGKAGDHRLHEVKRGADGRNWVVEKRTDGTKFWHHQSLGKKSTPGRKIPPWAASCFKYGTHKRGLDGCVYSVFKPHGGKILRWRHTTGGPECGNWSKGSPRQAPTEPAGRYPLGTRKKGHDGRMWRVVKHSNRVHVWHRVPRAT